MWSNVKSRPQSTAAENRRPRQTSTVARRLGGQPAIDESRQFAKWYRRRAEELGTAFFDASTVARPDPNDGVHLDAANTRAIGDALVPIVAGLLGP